MIKPSNPDENFKRGDDRLMTLEMTPDPGLGEAPGTNVKSFFLPLVVAGSGHSSY